MIFVAVSVTILVVLVVIQLVYDRRFISRLKDLDSSLAESISPSFREASTKKESAYKKFLMKREYRGFEDPELSRLGDTLVALYRIYIAVFIGVCFVLLGYWVLSGAM